MKKYVIISLLILLTLVGVYFFSKSPSDQTYNWNLELTKPLDYNITLRNIGYYKNDKKLFRNTTMNSFSGWSGSASGRVLHNTPKEYLPDSVKLSWEETNTNIIYTAAFAFPKQKILTYWNENYKLLQQKWGADYPKGQLSIKLGIAPNGLMTLWFSDLDINTSGFAMEIESYYETAGIIEKQQTNVKPSQVIKNSRFGTPHFYTFEDENVVAIHILYHNGESNTINLKNKNGSILETMNTERGWSLAKEITVHWFDKDRKGYKSIYEVAKQKLTKNTIEKPNNTNLIYLLDRANTPNSVWNTMTNTHIFELTAIKQKAINE